MDKLIDLLSQRRIWVALIPLVIGVGDAFGIKLTEELLTNTGDQIVAGVMAALALWSYVRPK